MAVVALIETADNNRGRFVAESVEDAIEELGRHFPVGATVAERLRKGERIVNDSYTLAIRPLETEPPKTQQSLF
jgi:hypothetical protein